LLKIDFHQNNKLKMESYGPIPGMVESLDFDGAIEDNKKYLRQLQDRILRVHARIKYIEKTREDGVYSSMALRHKSYEARSAMTNIEKEMPGFGKEDPETEISRKIHKHIIKRWKYVYECANYIGIRTYLCLGPFKFPLKETPPPLEGGEQMMKRYKTDIESVIISAHKTHHNLLLEKVKEDIVRCPVRCGKSGCVVSRVGGRTSECQIETYVDTINIDWLKGYSLHSTSPVGTIEAI
jgi:hypothetical protein